MPGIIEVRQDQAIGGASGLLSLLSVNRHSAPYQAAFPHHDLERACQSLDDRQQVATIFNAPMTLFTADEVAEMLEGQG